jgi:hypothetical protein
MKNLALSILCIGLIAACSPKEESTTEDPIAVAEVVEYEYFGDSSFSTDGSVPSTKLMAYMGGKDSVEAVVSGTIAEVCQKKGCWMSMEVDNGTTMHVSYDYEFLLPMNSAGKEIVMDGYAFYDTIPVDYLRHLAEDAGKTEEEINAITEPKATLSYLATGVMIKK